MAGQERDSRTRILDAAYDLFYAEGFSRVGMDEIAARAGFTKRTLYYHFDSKDALLAAVLDHRGAHSLRRIEDWARADAATPAAVIDNLFAALDDWAATPKWKGSGFTRLAMELADLPGHPARAVARTHKAAIETRLAGILRDAGTVEADDMAAQLAVLLEGAQVLTLIHGDTAYIDHAHAAARRLLASARS
jgi:AcrR family transcriptional regulator